MYLVIVFAMLSGFSWMTAIGANIAAFAWIVICGLIAFEIAKIEADRWRKLDGR